MEEFVQEQSEVIWTKGKDLVVSILCQVYGMKRFVESDEKVYYRFDPRDAEDKKIEASTIEVEVNEETKMIEATVEASEELKELYPGALVSIDGKEYDLKKLDEKVELIPGKSHRISILWVVGELVETFVIE